MNNIELFWRGPYQFVKKDQGDFRLASPHFGENATKHGVYFMVLKDPSTELRYIKTIGQTGGESLTRGKGFKQRFDQHVSSLKNGSYRTFKTEDLFKNDFDTMFDWDYIGFENLGFISEIEERIHPHFSKNRYAKHNWKLFNFLEKLFLEDQRLEIKWINPEEFLEDLEVFLTKDRSKNTKFYGKEEIEFTLKDLLKNYFKKNQDLIFQQSFELYYDHCEIFIAEVKDREVIKSIEKILTVNVASSSSDDIAKRYIITLQNTAASQYKFHNYHFLFNNFSYSEPLTILNFPGLDEEIRLP